MDLDNDSNPSPATPWRSVAGGTLMPVAPPTTLSRRSTWRFALGHPAHFVALGFGTGLIPVAPGTFGTLVAFPLYWWLQLHLAPVPLLAVIAALYVAGIWICGAAGRALGVSDHGSIVWDEIVAFMLVLFFTPPMPSWQIAAFVLFRAFDAGKPGPVGYVDSRFKGGFGVMLDDLVAAFLTLFCFTLFKLASSGFSA